MHWRGLLNLCCTVVALTACGGREDAPRAPARVITSAATERASVALTFDVLDDAGETDAILSLLSARGVRGTFAISGLWAEEHPALLNAIASDGHQIINFTYNHASFTGASTGTPALTREQRTLELSRTETTVFRMSSRSTRPYFRPPYGDIDESVLRDAADAGYAFAVLWTIDVRAEPETSPEAAAESVIADAQPGAIIALSLGRSTADALPAILEGLTSRGFAFETVAEIIE